MAIKIVDADINRLRRASKAGRARSPETVRIIKAIGDLRPGKAKALVPEGNETVTRLRSRLGYAARAAGVKLRVATDDSKVMFTLRAGAGARSRGDAADRRAAVQAKAVELGRNGKTVTADALLSALSKDGVSFDVARPATMVGAVLRAMPEFERTGKNEFRYKA